SLSTIRTRSFGLQPVEERQVELTGAFHGFPELLLAYVDQVTQHVVVLRPVYERHIGGDGARFEIVSVHNSPVQPKIQRITGRNPPRVKSQGSGLECLGIRIAEIQ